MRTQRKARRRRRRQLSLLAGAALMAAAIRSHRADDSLSSAASSGQTAAGDIEAWVEQLNAPGRREREAAERKLLEQGPAALMRLPLPGPERPPAVSEALARIRNTLELRTALLTSQASRVTLETEAPLKVILERLSDATGNRIVLEGAAAEESLHVAWDQTPFWEAVIELRNRAGLELQPDSGEEFLRLERRTMNVRPEFAAMVSGPCLVEIVSVDLKPSFIDPPRRILQLRWRIRVEPRLQPMYLIAADGDMHAALEDAAVRPLSPAARREFPADRVKGCEIDTAFDIPAGDDRPRGTFGGRAILKIAALPLPLTFAHLEPGRIAAARGGRVSAVVRNVNWQPESKFLSLEISVSYDRGGPEFESHRMWLDQNAAWLESETGGTRIRPDHVELLQIARSGGTMEYGFENVPSAAEMRFLYEAPTLIVDVPVEFEGLAFDMNFASSSAP